jgi:predicted nucleic acid-binding protein
MGQLNLADKSRVYVDTAVIIYSVEANQTYFALLEPLWEKLQTGELEVFTSELAVLETLVVPIRNGDTQLIDTYEQFLLSSEVQLLPVSQVVLKEAAKLRAATKLRTPDAIHAATALVTGCTRFLTNDEGFRNVAGLPVMLLDEVLAT